MRSYISRVGFVPAAVLAVVLAAAAATPARAQDQTKSRPRPQICTEQWAPVCGKKNGVTKTYSNACFAAADGAAVVAQGPCR